MASGRASGYEKGMSLRWVGTGHRVRMWSARAGIAALVPVLSACAGHLAAPVDSRVDRAVTTESVAAPPVSVPSAAPAVPETSTVPESARPPEPVSAEAVAEQVPAEAVAEPGESATRRVVALNPAIVDLLNAANRHSTAGRHDGAVAALERALKIEPSDPGLWHRLARVRLEQDKADLAEALAAKSNSLAAGDPNLQAQNWRLIARARQHLGDAAGASDALERAARLRN